MELCELINQIHEAMGRELSDEYLASNGCSTREEVGIGEYLYGIVMCPISWVLPYLEELNELRSKNRKD